MNTWVVKELFKLEDNLTSSQTVFYLSEQARLFQSLQLRKVLQPVNTEVTPLRKFQLEFICIQHKDNIISVLPNSLYLLDWLSRYTLRHMYPLIPFLWLCHLGTSLLTCKNNHVFLLLSHLQLMSSATLPEFLPSVPHYLGILLIVFDFISHTAIF